MYLLGGSWVARSKVISTLNKDMSSYNSSCLTCNPTYNYSLNPKP